MTIKILTKSNYITGLQSLKLLWITKNNKERIPEPSDIDKKKFEKGLYIGNLATTLFEGGISLADEDFEHNIEKTKEFIRKRVPLFEPSFLVDRFYSRADILEPVGDNEWNIIEVKMGTKITDLNINDVAFQKLVYEGAELKIRECYLMHLNKEYVKKGVIDPKKLFVKESVSERIRLIEKELKKDINNMIKIIDGPEPEFSIDEFMTTEYDNVCLNEFMETLPEDSVFNFYRMNKSKRVSLFKRGYRLMRDVPPSEELSEKQSIQKQLSSEGGIHVGTTEIRKFLGRLHYPIHYLDFETINPPLPIFDGMRPYQRIPFQFSLHVQEKPDGETKHIKFLAEGPKDPRHEFMQLLKDNLGEEGSILVYNESFEKGVMDESATAIPEFRKWYNLNIIPRIRDLLEVFKDFDYYDPRQRGSASIKAVLPVMSDLSYGGLEYVRKGDEASYQWERVTFGNVSIEERTKIRKALEKYSELDTLAEVKIVERLREISRVSN